MNHSEKLAVLQSLRPDAEFILSGDKIQWLDKNQSEPTDDEIQEGFDQYQIRLVEEANLQQIKKEAAVAKLAALGLEIDDLKALSLA